MFDSGSSHLFTYLDGPLICAWSYLDSWDEIVLHRQWDRWGPRPLTDLDFPLITQYIRTGSSGDEMRLSVPFSRRGGFLESPSLSRRVSLGSQRVLVTHLPSMYPVSCGDDNDVGLGCND